MSATWKFPIDYLNGRQRREHISLGLSWGAQAEVSQYIKHNWSNYGVNYTDQKLKLESLKNPAQKLIDQAHKN